VDNLLNEKRSIKGQNYVHFFILIYLRKDETHVYHILVDSEDNHEMVMSQGMVVDVMGK